MQVHRQVSGGGGGVGIKAYNEKYCHRSEIQKSGKKCLRHTNPVFSINFAEFLYSSVTFGARVAKTVQ